MAFKVLNTAGASAFLSRISLTRIMAPASRSFNNARCLIGNREIVGFGFNGQPNYMDRPDFPFPAIRWKEPTPEIQALHEKEKGDWRKLTMEEKKALYRASYCQTFAEFQAPTGEWKSIIGITLFLVSLGLWPFYAYKKWVAPPLPETILNEELRKCQLRRMIDLQMNPITGLASKWDYENDDWKK